MRIHRVNVTDTPVDIPGSLIPSEARGPITFTIRNLGSVAVNYADTQGNPASGFPLESAEEVTLTLSGAQGQRTLQFAGPSGSTVAVAVRLENWT